MVRPGHGRTGGGRRVRLFWGFGDAPRTAAQARAESRKVAKTLAEDAGTGATNSAAGSGAPTAATRGRIGGPRGRRGGRRGRGEPLRVRAATDAARPGGLADRGNQTH